MACVLKPSDAEFSIVHMLYNKYILPNVLLYSIAVNFLRAVLYLRRARRLNQLKRVKMLCDIAHQDV